MKKVITMLMVLGLVGCATNSDIENIQTQVDGLKVSVAQVSTDAAFAREAAEQASTQALKAQKAAEIAAALSEQASAKLDSLY